MIRVARVLISGGVYETALIFAYGVLLPFPASVPVVVLGHPFTLPLISHVPIWVPVVVLLAIMVAVRSLYQQFQGHQWRLLALLALGMIAGIVCLRLNILWFALFALSGGVVMISLTCLEAIIALVLFIGNRKAAA